MKFYDLVTEDADGSVYQTEFLTLSDVLAVIGGMDNYISPRITITVSTQA